MAEYFGLETQSGGNSMMRDSMLKINAVFSKHLGSKARLVNCGKVPNDETGDTVDVAMEKIIENLILIATQEPPSPELVGPHGPGEAG